MATFAGSVSFGGSYSMVAGDATNQHTASGSTPSPALNWGDGNGSGSANTAFWSNFTIGTGNATTYSLIGANGEKDALNNDLSLASVKEVVITIASPIAGKQVAFGPQSVANSCPLWFANATTGNETISDAAAHVNRLAAGWAVSNVTHNITLSNTGNISVSGQLLVIGVSN